MKALWVEEVQSVADPVRRVNLVRENLQVLALRSLHESAAFRQMAFVGGTALRFLHQIPRFSEDLDFSLCDRTDGYKPADWMDKLLRDLKFAGFDAEVRWNDQRNVHSGWIRVPGLLHEIGFSGHSKQKLSIKLEIDTNPPRGANWKDTVITHRQSVVALRHYDLPSLMAGKIHALLARGYPKGRDWYDLIWYLGHRPPLEPNLTLLQNALDQTHSDANFKASDWHRSLIFRLDQIDVAALKQDVHPFLEHARDVGLLQRDNLERLITGQAL